jgi:hypothetical protein
MGVYLSAKEGPASLSTSLAPSISFVCLDRRHVDSSEARGSPDDGLRGGHFCLLQTLLDNASAGESGSPFWKLQLTPTDCFQGKMVLDTKSKVRSPSKELRI